jgi:hypothetical protein
MFKYNITELNELKESVDKLRKLENRTPEPLTLELLDNLTQHFYLWYSKRDPDKLFEKPFPSGCGCMGPRNGDLFCGCTMSILMYEYRYDIALEIVNK